MPDQVRLTDFQAVEVQGLLDVCADEQTISGERSPWGRLILCDGRWVLEVTDPTDAIDDLHYRADHLIGEAASVGSNGTAAARSLRELAMRIGVSCSAGDAETDRGRGATL